MGFDSFLANKETGAELRLFLRGACSQLTEQEYKTAISQISVALSLDVVQYNEQARKLLQALSDNTKFSFTDLFEHAVRTFLPHEKKLKPLERKLNKDTSQAPQNPSFEFIRAINYLIYERRCWRRYLRSRFGL